MNPHKPFRLNRNVGSIITNHKPTARIRFAFLSAVALLLADRIAAYWLGMEGLFNGLTPDALGQSGASLLLFWGVGHCDGLDGPVVTLARKALETGNVNLVLPWVQAKDEAEITKAFEHAMSVRELSPAAKEPADLHFFETLVRVHRAGEGAPYTGLKPAGRDLGPAIPAADKALEDGSVDAVVELITAAVREGIHRHFQAAVSRKRFRPDDVEAGREFVEAYVPYVHYVERLWQAASGEAHGHHAGAVAHEH